MKTKKTNPFTARIRSLSTPMLLDLLTQLGTGNSPGEDTVSGFVKDELSDRIDWDTVTKEERENMPDDAAGLAEFYARHLA